MACGSMQSGCVFFSEKVYANRNLLSKDPEKLCKRVNPDPKKNSGSQWRETEDGATDQVGEPSFF